MVYTCETIIWKDAIVAVANDLCSCHGRNAVVGHGSNLMKHDENSFVILCWKWTVDNCHCPEPRKLTASVLH